MPVPRPACDSAWASSRITLMRSFLSQWVNLPLKGSWNQADQHQPLSVLGSFPPCQPERLEGAKGLYAAAKLNAGAWAKLGGSGRSWASGQGQHLSSQCLGAG